MANAWYSADRRWAWVDGCDDRYSPTTDVIAIGAQAQNAGFSAVQKMKFLMAPGFTQSNGARTHVTNSHNVTLSEIVVG